MGHVLTLSAPDGTHAVELHPDFQAWAIADTGTSIPDEVRDRGRALMAEVVGTDKRIPRDQVWGWVRALRAAWRRAPRSYLRLWIRRPDGREETTEAYLSDGTDAWMVEALPGQLTIVRLKPAVAAERRKSRKDRWLAADTTLVDAWHQAGVIPPEAMQLLCGTGPLQLEHATPGQHFAKELAALEALVLHLEATGLPEAVCARS